ncbi:hypothetical protein [Novipirellula rosea]|uniref:MarR family protein n=1 Tax=Novipirellula rosea TaxID=1031540 RepID=A0ABP8NG83_9BACT
MTATIDTADDIDLGPAHPHDVPYLRLSSECVRECGIGPAITLAVYFSTGGSKWNFRSIETLGLVEITGFGGATIDRHLRKLIESGWMEKGSRKGTGRRTPTRRLTPKFQRHDRDLSLVLPTWALDSGLSLSALVLVAKMWSAVRGKTHAREGIEEGTRLIRESIGSLATEYTWRISTLMQATGISRKSVKNARQSLVDAGVINGDDSDDRPGYISLVPVIDVTEMGDLLIGGPMCKKRGLGVSKMRFGSRGVSVKNEVCSYSKDFTFSCSKENEPNAITRDGIEILNLIRSKKEKQQTRVASSQTRTAPTPKQKAQPAATSADPVSRVWFAYPERMRKSRGRVKDALNASIRYLVRSRTVTIEEGSDPIDVSTQTLALEFVLSRLEAFAKSKEGRSGVIPEPATWLKNMRFLESDATWRHCIQDPCMPIDRRVEVEYSTGEGALPRRMRELREARDARAKAAAAAEAAA